MKTPARDGTKMGDLERFVRLILTSKQESLQRGALAM
jgi:hypothetical protein